MTIISFYATKYLFPELHEYANNTTNPKDGAWADMAIYFMLPYLSSWVMNRCLYFFQPKSELEIRVNKNINFIAYDKDLNLNKIANNNTGNAHASIILSCPDTFRGSKDKNKNINYIILNGKLVGAIAENEHSKILVKDRHNILGVYSKTPNWQSNKLRYNFIEISLERDEIRYVNIVGPGFWGPTIEIISNQEEIALIKETKFVFLVQDDKKMND